jgi:hypothetical protein
MAPIAGREGKERVRLRCSPSRWLSLFTHVANPMRVASITREPGKARPRCGVQAGQRQERRGQVLQPAGKLQAQFQLPQNELIRIASTP